MGEAFFFANINRKPLHELNIDKPENTSIGLGNFQEIKKVNYDDEVLSYDVVQISINGQTLLPYKIFAESKQQVDKQSF